MKLTFPRLPPLTWVAVVVFLGMALACYARLFIGVGLLGYMDESYWVTAAAQSSFGGRPLINDMHMQQLCGLLYEPLVWLYYKLFGNFALLLFVRHLYFIYSAVVAAIYFKFFRSKVGTVTALAIAALPLVGTAWAEPSLGYNSIGGLGFGAGALLAIRSVELGRPRLAAWSGLFFFWVLGAYPTLVGGLGLLWLLLGLSAFYVGKPFVRQALIANAITATLLAGFVGSLVWRASVENLLFIYTFSVAHASLGDIFAKLRYAFGLTLAFAPPLWLWLPGLALWLGLWFWRRVSWYAFAIPLSLAIALREPPEAGTFHPPLFMLLVFSSLPLAARAARDFRKQWPELVLFTTALLSAILTCWSSAMTIYVTFVTSTYCFAAIMTWAPSRRWPRISAALAFVIPLIVFAHKVVIHQTDDYRVETEGAWLTRGPVAGLWTSRARAAFLNQVQDDIDDLNQTARSILFYDEFPLGFLMSPLLPATRSLWMHTLRESSRVRPFFQNYYADPQTRPDVIFRFKYFMDNGVRVSVEPAQFLPAVDVFWHYLPEESHDYFLYRDREAYSIFKRNSLAKP